MGKTKQETKPPMVRETSWLASHPLFPFPVRLIVPRPKHKAKKKNNQEKENRKEKKRKEKKKREVKISK
jgi:hypothetical protein